MSGWWRCSAPKAKHRDHRAHRGHPDKVPCAPCAPCVSNTTAEGRRAGVTLAELMVVIVILGVMAAVTGIAFARRAPVPVADARVAAVEAARAESIRSGRPATIRVEVDGEPWLATLHPDGRVVTDAPLGIDPLSGRRDDRR